MLWVLGGIMILSFPVSVGVGSAATGGEKVIESTYGGGVATLQGMLFGVATFAVVMAKRVLGELWMTKARGAYKVDGVLRVMVRGLQRELDERTVEATEAFR